MRNFLGNLNEFIVRVRCGTVDFVAVAQSRMDSTVRSTGHEEI